MSPETSRRRATIRWTSSSEVGDAAEAVAELEAWLAADPGRGVDWDAVLAQLRDALLRASLEPVLMDDGEARALLMETAAAEDVESLDAAVARLSDRVSHLVEARERRALASPRLVGRLVADHRARAARTMVRI